MYLTHRDSTVSLCTQPAFSIFFSRAWDVKNRYIPSDGPERDVACSLPSVHWDPGWLISRSQLWSPCSILETLFPQHSPDLRRGMGSTRHCQCVTHLLPERSRESVLHILGCGTPQPKPSSCKGGRERYKQQHSRLSSNPSNSYIPIKPKDSNEKPEVDKMNKKKKTQTHKTEPYAVYRKCVYNPEP